MNQIWAEGRPLPGKGVFRMKQWIALLFALMLVCSTALAQNTTYVFPYEGLRYTQQDGETVLTQTNLKEHTALIEAMGTTPDAILASYIASGIMLEVIPDEGGQIAVSVADAGAFAAVESMDELGGEELASFAAQFENSGLYESVSITETAPVCVRMTSSAMYGSMPVYSLRYATLHLGRMYLFTQTIVGRAPEAADDALIERVLSGVKLLSDIPDPTPVPTAVPTPTPVPTPEPTPGVAGVVASEGNMNVEGVPAFTTEGSIAISGTTDASAQVSVVCGGETLGKTTAKKDGTFALRVTLPEEGDLTLAVMTDTSEQMLSIRYEMPAAKLVITGPEETTFTGETMTIRGETEPGATVFVEGGGFRTNVEANRNGAFSVRVRMDDEGTVEYILRAKADGFKETSKSLALTRVLTEREGIARFRQKMAEPKYGEYVANYAKYDGRNIKYRGKVMAFTDYSGSPCALVCVENVSTGVWKDPIWIILDPATEIAVGQIATFYFVGEGQTLPAGGEYTVSGNEIEAPVGRAKYVSDIRTPNL